MSDLTKFTFPRDTMRPLHSYTVFKKTRAFCRGLVSCQPLVEVAKEGMRGGYILDFETEMKYAKIVSQTCVPHEVFDILYSECSTPAQEMLALTFKHAFERGLRKLSLIARYLWDYSPSYQLFRKAGKWTAEELDDIREMETLLLTNGKIISEKAQSIMASTFRHYNILDTHFGYFVTNRYKQVLRILGSPHADETIKQMLMPRPVGGSQEQPSIPGNQNIDKCL